MLRHPDATLVACDAGSDFVEPAVTRLAHDLGIRNVGAGHTDHVSNTLAQDSLGGRKIVDSPDRKNRHVGYSLLDYNLRLLFKTLRWKIDSASVPDMYSVDYHPDPLIFDVWHNQRRYVKFIAQDVWAFVPRLYERVLGKEFQPSPS